MSPGSASRAGTVVAGLVSVLVLATPTTATEPHPDGHGFAWESFAGDTRSVSLGRSDLTAGDGPAGFWMNPAVLPGEDRGLAGYRHHEYPVEGRIRGFAAAAGFGSWSIGWSGADYVVDGIPVRTAGDPLGTGATYDVRQRIDVLAASYGVITRMPGADTWFDMALGGSLRRYGASVDGTDGSATDFDLGTTVRYFSRTERGWFDARGALVGRNLTGGTYTFDQVPVYLPHHVSLGISFEGGRSLGRRDENDLRGLVTYTHRRHLRTHPGTPDDSNHFGMELCLYDLFALRAGYGNVAFGGGKASWGVGLSSRGLVESSWVATVDFGQIDADRLGGWLPMFSVALTRYSGVR